MAEARQKLPIRVAVGYGVGDLSSSLAVTTNALFLLMFATDVLGLSGAMAGTALLIGKCFDAITDPLMGEISDRTRHKWGRKRPYLLYGAIPFGLSFFVLYSLPKVASPSLQFVLFTFCCALQSLCFTICNIPYASLTASLTHDSDERTRLTTFRFAFSTLATILVAVATLGIYKKLSFGWVGAIYGVLMVLSLWITFATTEEPPFEEQQLPPFSIKNSLMNYAKSWNNRPFRILVGVFFFHTIAFALLGAWIVYYAKHSLLMKDEELVISPMIAMTLVMLVPWYFLSEKLGKKRSYLLGSLCSIPALLLLFVPAAKDTTTIVLCALIIGVGFASYTLFPYAIMPDTIEYDEYHTGLRREGMFYGVFVFVEKVGRGCAFLIAGWGLSLIGYAKGAPLPEGFGGSMRALIALTPIVFVVLGIPFLMRYPLTKSEHERIKRELEARKAQAEDAQAEDAGLDGEGSEASEASESPRKEA